MHKIRFILVVAISMLFSINLASQTTQKSTNGETASKCLWSGSFEVTRKWSGWTETMVGTVKFESLGIDNLGNEMHNLIGCNLTWSASGTLDGSACIFQGGPLSYNDSSLVKGYLQIFSNGTYYGPFSITDDLSSSVNYTCPDYSYKLPSHTHNMQIGGPYHDFLVQNDQIKGEYTSPGSPIGIDLKEFWKWDLHKEGASEPKLIVEVAGYHNWMPEAAMHEVEGIGKDVGNVIKFQASLVEADGTTICAKADSFTFQLKNVSHEPGVCLNYPRAEVAETDHDLHFKQELNSPTDVMSSDRLTLQTKEGREATATVASFDWGGYGTLIVTAHMQGGKKITGLLKGHTEITEIPIPKRSSDSKIADQWKKDHDVEGLADVDDTEDRPVGDGDVGDGFTLYEEYRGFSVKGEHIMGDPKTKDLFVLPESDDFLPGIQLFKALTGLNVHYQLFGYWEFDREIRMMNFNHSDAPHSVDQHGLWIKKDDSRGYSYTFLGPPKKSGPVNIHSAAYGFQTITRGSSREITNELNSTVAHELGHAVRIEHHGEADKTLTYSSLMAFNTSTETFDIVFSESGHTGNVILKWENDRLFTQRIMGKKYIAVWGGEHCGVEDCIMRYDVAFAYIPGTGGDIRYIVRDDERTGIMLCDKKEDNPGGVNYLGRQPRSRYGSAVKGNCIHQICVNDKYH